jgi:integrase
MASILLRPSSRYWCACFRDENGRQRRETTKLTDKKAAQRIADHYENLAQRRLRAQRVREITNRLITEFYGAEVSSVSVRECVEKWLAIKRPTVTATTMDTYEKSVTKLLAFLGPAAEEDISLVSKNTLLGFRAHVAERVSSTTVNYDLKVVHAIFKDAKNQGYLVDNPAEFVEPVRREERSVERRPFTLNELRAVLAVANDEWKSLIRFGLYTGQRLGDISALTWANLDLEQNTIRLEPRKTRKTRKVLTIPIAEPLRAHILSLPAGESPKAPLHPRAYRAVTQERKNGRKNTSDLSTEFVNLLVSVGIREPIVRKRTGKGFGGRRVSSELSFHSLRHTAVSLLKETGAPHAVVQELIGHESEAVSRAYTHVGIEALQKAAAALPTI